MSSNQSPQPRPKRRKIQLACRNCRSNKSRCDGVRPVCSSCHKRGITESCIYERPQLPTNGHPIRAAKLPPQGQHPEDSGFPSSEEILGDNADAETYQLDALATVSSGNNDDSLYGGSSTIAFVQQKFSQTPAQQVPPLEARLLHRRPTRLFQQSESASVYPARRKADNFLHCFWEFIHPVFPVLHKTSFIAKYDKLWFAESSLVASENVHEEEEVLFSACLNLTFALGCQFSTLLEASQKRSAADDFYWRARRLYVFDILDSRSFMSVQMLLLTGIYLQSTPHANRCWTSIGLAIRLAQSQGLHLDGPGRRPESQLTSQMRRRVWHTCVVLDILSAMTYGRPTMLNDQCKVPVPLAIDDEYLSVSSVGVQPSNVPSRLGLFVSTCTLFKILHEILSNFYSGNDDTAGSTLCKPDQSKGTLLADVLSYTRRLDAFHSTIPGYLYIGTSARVSANEKNGYINLQQQILYCRFLYTRLLSLRPLLLLAGGSQYQAQPQSNNIDVPHTSLDDELISSCCNLCIKTALSLVDTIHQNLYTAYRSSGWHSVYFTFAAATIVLAGSKCQGLGVSVHPESFDRCWQQCLSILDHYKDQIHSAPRAVKVLQNIRRQVIGGQSQQAQMDANNGTTANVASESSWPFELSQFNADGADFISDVWFGQQLSSLDWMEMHPYLGDGTTL